MAKPGLDGHDRGAKTIARALRDAGFEVIYTGLHQSIDTIVGAAVDEGVDVVGISVLSGAHLSYTRELRSRMDESGLTEVPIVVGGIIPPADVATLLEQGASEVFPPNTNLLEIPERIRRILPTTVGDEP
ncbi:MAG: cobalamin B12-binding domain-containing protein [Acidimicrobiia bacterium]|nr:cobalamin B12-binding domain-containing protein [Acidimicrobiia bacterium]